MYTLNLKQEINKSTTQNQMDLAYMYVSEIGL